MEPGELAGFKFYTADVTALFTNVNVETSINDVIEFASDYWAQIDTYGLKLVDLHQHGCKKCELGEPSSVHIGNFSCTLVLTY